MCGFMKAVGLESCLSSRQQVPESRAADRFPEGMSVSPSRSRSGLNPIRRQRLRPVKPCSEPRSRYAGMPIAFSLLLVAAANGASPRPLSHRNSGVPRVRLPADRHEDRSRLPCHEVPMLASPSSATRALIVERIGRAALVIAVVALGGCSTSSSEDRGQVPRTFSTLADCLFRGTAEHHGENLSADEAHRLAANPFGISLRQLHSLDAAAARELAACRGFLHFAALPMLTPAAAAELAAHTEDLRLDRLETLSADTARALAWHTGSIHLNGLQSIDVATAEALATHEGLLALNGLEDPEEVVILALARHRGHLCINGVTTLSPRAAGAIAARRQKASLHGLSSLTYQSFLRLPHDRDRSGVDLPDWIPAGRSGALSLSRSAGKGVDEPLPRPLPTLASIND